LASPQDRADDRGARRAGGPAQGK